MKFLVIGDSCVDVFVYGTANRLCPDAPVPVFLSVNEIRNGGMASNVYNNIKSLGGDVDIISNDNIVTKTRYIDKATNQMIMRLDSDIGKSNRIKDIESINFTEYDYVIVSDYNKGFLDYDDIDYICNNHNRVFIDTKKIIKDRFRRAFCIKINEIEYNNNLNVGHDITKTHNNVIVTLSSKGCKFNDVIYPVKKVEIKDMSGAGDTFISGLVTCYANTNNWNNAIEFANKCSTVVVQKRGVSIILPTEIQ